MWLVGGRVSETQVGCEMPRSTKSKISGAPAPHLQTGCAPAPSPSPEFGGAA